jgi:hypothetical protein
MFGHIVFRIRRTAVDATEIAAVGHGDAQVVNLAAEFVKQWHVFLGSRR